MAQQKMLQFTKVDRRTPDKRPAAERTEDFAEIYGGFATPRAGEQASRCEQCGIPFCSLHCPLHNNIPDWLMLAATGRMEEAYAVASATNTLPEICGRICPQDRLCEGSCVLEQSSHGGVTIGAMEKHITDSAFAAGWVKPFSPRIERLESVGVIGAGPAGLAAAEQLRMLGYRVEVYDRHDRAGGLLTYGIPGFKLEKDVVARRVAVFVESGVIFHTDVDVGRDVTLAEMRRKHAAVVIATGVYAARGLEISGNTLDGVIPALEFLTCSNRLNMGDSVADFDSGRLNAAGKRVVVVGGGDTAMDCLRTALRQGATSVKCLYRRDRANMPGSQREVDNAIEEGAEFIWQAAPEAVEGASGRVSGVRTVKMHLGLPDASGRQSPTPVPGSEYTLPAEMVIEALGFEPEDLPTIFGAPELKVKRNGTLAVDDALMTSLPGVFAAGDIVRGASLVVWAVRDGRDVAQHVHAYVRRAAAAPSLANAG
ncbi:NAD(P)-dependent oxidoreductase [Oleispirillum naphthae]|uniref:NAD(P)-dependent oxidoreductase n=1 Tax=Oleispirillum naphthae TaxID=2838853 RepID=UPI0030824DEF